MVLESVSVGGLVTAIFVILGFMWTLISRFETRFDTIDSKFDKVDARFDKVDARFEAMDAKFATFGLRLDGLSAQLAETDHRLTGRLDQIDTRLVAVEYG